MPTTIRLKRMGRKKQPSYRIVVTDSARAVTGPSIERLGIYNPRTAPSVLKLDVVRTIHWLREGAEPSHTVRSLLRRAGVWEMFHTGLTPEQVAVSDQAEILLGPAPGEWKTSQRPMPEERPQAERERAPAEPEAEAEPAPEAEAEAVAAEASTEVEEAAEEVPADKAAGGTEASDEIREGSAVPSAEKAEPAAAPAQEEDGSEATEEADDAGEAEEEEEK